MVTEESIRDKRDAIAYRIKRGLDGPVPTRPGLYWVYNHYGEWSLEKVVHVVGLGLCLWCHPGYWEIGNVHPSNWGGELK